MTVRCSASLRVERRSCIALLIGAALSTVLPRRYGVGAAAWAEGNEVWEDFLALPKAAWVWGVSMEAIADHVAFALRAGIGTLFFSLDARARAALLAGDAQPRSALEEARAQGLRILALTGDPAWVRPPPDLPRSIVELLAIHRRYFAFDGLHLDVEPHALPAWDGPDRVLLAMGYLVLLDRVRAVPGRPPLEAALHPTYAEVPSPRGAGATLLDAALERLDSGATLMAYRDDPKRTVEWAARALPGLARAERPWRCGVLVHASDAGEKGTTYYGSSRRHFLADMVLLDQKLRTGEGGNAYAGLAFEDLNALEGLLAADRQAP
jgi:hypothetical protein